MNTWTDASGKRWKVPQIKDRLRPHQIAGHAALRDYVVKRDKCCAWCGATTNLVADHIRSKRNGGMHHPRNLQALCFGCNSSKANAVDRKTTKRKDAVTHNEMMQMKRVCAKAIARLPKEEIGQTHLEAVTTLDHAIVTPYPQEAIVDAIADMLIALEQMCLEIGPSKVAKRLKVKLQRLEERISDVKAA